MLATMSNLKDMAAAAHVGSVAVCPFCTTTFLKRTAKQTFCSNQRQEAGGSNCKDDYWNTVGRGISSKPALIRDAVRSMDDIHNGQTVRQSIEDIIERQKVAATVYVENA